MDEKRLFLTNSGEEIGPGLLTKIIKRDMQITREAFLEKLR